MIMRVSPQCKGFKGKKIQKWWTCAKAYKKIDFKAQASSSLSDCTWLELRILFKQRGDISLHFSNHRIPSFILFFSSYFFSFLSFSRIFLLFSEPFHRTLSIKHRQAILLSVSLNFWSPGQGQRGLGRPAQGVQAGRPGAFPGRIRSVFSVLLPFFITKL